MAAVQDAWFVGDEFLRETYQTLVQLKNLAVAARRNPPYLYQFFNVYGFYQNKASVIQGLARLLNSCIQGLNARPRLPKYLVFIPDRDLIDSIGYYGYGVTDVYVSCMFWLISQIDKCVKCRRAGLFDRKPGALSLDSPKVIWIKMLKRPYNGRQQFDQVMALRNRFNNALEEALAQYTKSQHYILSIKVDEDDFYRNGELTEEGKRDFWREVDSCLKRFDREEINLKPRAASSKPDYDNNKSGSLRRKMPTPPLRSRSSSHADKENRLHFKYAHH